MEVVRSEEELTLGDRRWRESERVRVTKRVVTEDRTIVVPVRREELVIERLPVVDGRLLPASPGPVEDLVLILHEEIIEVNSRVVPVERVCITVGRETEQVVFSDVIRKEQVRLEDEAR